MLALAFAIGGGIVYLLLPGTASWYLAALPTIPAVLILLSFPRDENQAGGSGSGDGPWTAP